MNISNFTYINPSQSRERKMCTVGVN